MQFLPFAKVERSRISRRGRIAGAAKNVLVTTTERSDDSSGGDGDKLLEENREFCYDQKYWSHNIHNYTFGDDHEAFISDPSFEHLTLCTEPAVFKHYLWSLVPFGLGMHACLGRRLALRMVDAILYNFLNYNVTYGMVPSMSTSKDFHERILVAMAAVYNMPADPAAYMPSVLNFPSGRKHYIIKIKWASER